MNPNPSSAEDYYKKVICVKDCKSYASSTTATADLDIFNNNIECYNTASSSAYTSDGGL